VWRKKEEERQGDKGSEQSRSINPSAEAQARRSIHPEAARDAILTRPTRPPRKKQEEEPQIDGCMRSLESKATFGRVVLKHVVDATG
jgi:hypothetical protein